LVPSSTSPLHPGQRLPRRPFFPVQPGVLTDNAAVGAHHARPERRHRDVIGPAIGAQHGLVLATPARQEPRRGFRENGLDRRPIPQRSEGSRTTFAPFRPRCGVDLMCIQLVTFLCEEANDELRRLPSLRDAVQAAPKDSDLLLRHVWPKK
jgi:hypothetical protein